MEEHIIAPFSAMPRVLVDTMVHDLFLDAFRYPYVFYSSLFVFSSFLLASFISLASFILYILFLSVDVSSQPRYIFTFLRWTVFPKEPTHKQPPELLKNSVEVPLTYVFQI